MRNANLALDRDYRARCPRSLRRHKLRASVAARYLDVRGKRQQGSLRSARGRDVKRWSKRRARERSVARLQVWPAGERHRSRRTYPGPRREGPRPAGPSFSARNSPDLGWAAVYGSQGTKRPYTARSACRARWRCALVLEGLPRGFGKAVRAKRRRSAHMPRLMMAQRTRRRRKQMAVSRPRPTRNSDV